jgi:hypothetical protein
MMPIQISAYSFDWGVRAGFFTIFVIDNFEIQGSGIEMKSF